MNCLNFLWNILTYVRFWQHFPVKTQLTEVLSLSRGKIGSFCFSASEVDRSHRSIRTENLKFIFNVSAKIWIFSWELTLLISDSTIWHWCRMSFTTISRESLDFLIIEGPKTIANKKILVFNQILHFILKTHPSFSAPSNSQQHFCLQSSNAISDASASRNCVVEVSQANFEVPRTSALGLEACQPQWSCHKAHSAESVQVNFEWKASTDSTQHSHHPTSGRSKCARPIHFDWWVRSDSRLPRYCREFGRCQRCWALLFRQFWCTWRPEEARRSFLQTFEMGKMRIWVKFKTFIAWKKLEIIWEMWKKSLNKLFTHLFLRIQLTGVHCDNGQYSETLSCDEGESDDVCIFLNWFVTKCFHDFCFGEFVSLSDPSRFDALNEADTKRFWGAFRLFVTGDWPEGDRDPKWYFRCVFEGSGEGLSSLQCRADACTDSKAATRCGSAFWAPWHSCRNPPNWSRVNPKSNFSSLTESDLISFLDTVFRQLIQSAMSCWLCVCRSNSQSLSQAAG